jgi:predicted nucleic acid-binding protein
MKVFLDTNVLIAASIRQHPHFMPADAALHRCMSGADEGIIHAHSLLEFHSAVTQLPKGLAVPPTQVEPLLAAGILPFVRCVTLDPTEVIATQKQAGYLGLVGGMIYDFFLLQAALKEPVDRLLTFNVAHFRKIAPPEFHAAIQRPGEEGEKLKAES